MSAMNSADPVEVDIVPVASNHLNSLKLENNTDEQKTAYDVIDIDISQLLSMEDFWRNQVEEAFRHRNR
jgi:hypothetical protein